MEENYRRGLVHFNIGIRNATQRGGIFFPLQEAAERFLCQLPLDVIFTSGCIQCPWSPGHWKCRACSPRMSERATGTSAASIKHSVINFHPKRLSMLHKRSHSQSRACSFRTGSILSTAMNPWGENSYIKIKIKII